MLETLFTLNQKVSVSANHPWAGSVSAVVVEAPVEVTSVSDNWETTYSRVTDTKKGLSRTYWLRFEISQTDADGDGPYQEAEIEEIYILTHESVEIPASRFSK